MDEREQDPGNGKKYLETYGLLNDRVTSLNVFLDGKQVGPEGALEIARGLTENWSLTAVELRRNEIGSSGAVPLAQALVCNKTLLHLGLGRNKLSNSGGNHIAEALKLNQTLQSIDLEWNDLRDDCGIMLAEMLAVNNSLLEISLERNKIQRDGVAAIGAALAENAKLKSLNLGWNRAKIVGAIALADGLRKNNTLTSLNIAMNQIGQEGAFAISNALTENMILQSLNMQHNRISESVVMLGEALRLNHTLRELNIESVSITPELAVVFGEALLANRSLVSLNISKNNLQDKGVFAIADALKARTAIRFLDLSDTGFTAVAARAVADLIDSCPNLQALLLEDNNIGPDGSKIIAEKLKIQSSLTSCGLSRTMLGAGGVKAIAESLRQAPVIYLRNLQLTDNDAGHEATLTLCRALTRCSSLTSLNLSGNGVGDQVKEALCQVLVSNPNLPYVFLGSAAKMELKNHALYRDEAQPYLTQQLGIAWSPPETADESVGKPPDTHVPSENFASSNISTGSIMKGPTDNMEMPSSIDTLRPARGMQIFQTGGDSGSGQMLPAIGENTRSRITKCAGNNFKTLRAVQKPNTYQANKLESNINELLLTDDQLRKEFNKLDRNGNGYLDEDEFRAVYRSFDNYGVVPSDREIKSIIRKYNQRNDGKITYQEYCILMLGLAGSYTGTMSSKGGTKKVKVKKEPEDRFSTVSAATRELLQKEKELRDEIANVKKELRTKQDEKDKAMAKVRADNKATFDVIDAELESLRDERDRRVAQLTRDDLAKGASTLEKNTLVDKIKLAEFDKDCAMQEKYKIRDSVKLLMTVITNLQKKQATHKKHSKYKSLAEIDAHFNELDAKLRKAQKAEHDSVVKDIGRKKHDLNIARENLEVQEASTKELNEALAKVGPLEKRQKENEALCIELADALKMKYANLKNFHDHNKVKDNKNEDVKDIQEALNKVRKEIERVSKEKDDATRARQKFDDTDVKKLILERNKIEKALIEITAKIPEKAVPIDMEFADALIGSGGATINQLSKDFSCIIDVFRSTKRVVIRGDDDLEACADAIEAIIADAKANRLEEVHPYDSNITGELVRNLARMEKTSNARITLLRDASKIKYVGNTDAIEAAKELIAEFTLNSHREEVEIEREVAQCIRGKVLMGIQTGTGARSVSLREKSIVCWGKKDCVMEAVSQIKDLVAAMSESKLELPVPKGVLLKNIAGPGGKHVRAIEDDSKTYILIKDPVFIMGSKEGTQKAKQLLRSLFNDVRRDEVFVSYPQSMHFMLVRRMKPEKKEETPEAKPDEEEVKPDEEEVKPDEEEVKANGDDEEKEVEKEDAGEEVEEEDSKEEEKEEDSKEEKETEEGEKKADGSEEKTKMKKKRDRRRRKKKEAPPPCFLEKILRETGCETVSARRDAGNVVIVGKRDAVKAAKALLEEFLENHKMDTEKIPCTAALCRYLSTRRGKERSMLAKLRAVEGIDDVYPDPEKGRIEITGSKTGLETAREILTKLIDEKSPCLGTFEFERGRAGAIYGSKGVTINSIEKECKAVLHVDKLKNVVEILSKTPEGTASAIALLEKAIEADKEKNPVPRTGGKGGKGEGKGYSDDNPRPRRGDAGANGKGSKGDKPRGGKGAKSSNKA